MYPKETKYKCIVDYKYFTRSIRVVAKRYKVSKTTVHRWVQSDDRCMKYVKQLKQPKRQKQKERKKRICDCIAQAISSTPFITMAELAKTLNSKLDINLSSRTVHRYTRSLNYTFKNMKRVVNYQHDKSKVVQFCTDFQKAFHDNTIVSIDEAGFYVGDHPKKGWAIKGQAPVISTDRTVRRTKFSLIMAIGTEGVLYYEILDHNCKKADFIGFFERMQLPEGKTIVMDNLKSHHSKEVAKVIEAKKWTCLFTPPYSPACNPIEKVFGKLKPKYRRSCPSIASKDPMDFKNAFVALLREQNEYLSTFQNTYNFVNKTLDNYSLDPNYNFIGYENVKTHGYKHSKN